MYCCPIETNVTLYGLQATYKPALLLPQSCLIVVALLRSVRNSGASPADLHWSGAEGLDAFRKIRNSSSNSSNISIALKLDTDSSA